MLELATTNTYGTYNLYIFFFFSVFGSAMTFEVFDTVNLEIEGSASYCPAFLYRFTYSTAILVSLKLWQIKYSMFKEQLYWFLLVLKLFMKWFYMPFQALIRAKAASKLSNLKGFFPSWTNAMCSLRLYFSAKLELHLLLSKFFLFFMNWCNVYIYFLLCCKASTTIWKSSFLHELMPHVSSYCFCRQSWHCKYCICKVSCFHGVRQCVHSSFALL